MLKNTSALQLKKKKRKNDWNLILFSKKGLPVHYRALDMGSLQEEPQHSLLHLGAHRRNKGAIPSSLRRGQGQKTPSQNPLWHHSDLCLLPPARATGPGRPFATPARGQQHPRDFYPPFSKLGAGKRSESGEGRHDAPHRH